MNESSDQWPEKAREMERRILLRLRNDESTQAQIVRRTGMDKSTVSRLINTHGPGLFAILACMGHDFSTPGTVQVPEEDYQAMSRFAARYLQTLAQSDKDA